MPPLTLAEWREVQTVNLEGVFLTFRAFIPAMIERRDGSLIAISSMTGKRPLYGRTPYAAAKMGVIGLVRTLVFSQTVGASCLGTADRQLDPEHLLESGALSRIWPALMKPAVRAARLDIARIWPGRSSDRGRRTRRS